MLLKRNSFQIQLHRQGEDKKIIKGQKDVYHANINPFKKAGMATYYLIKQTSEQKQLPEIKKNVIIMIKGSIYLEDIMI